METEPTTFDPWAEVHPSERVQNSAWHYKALVDYMSASGAGEPPPLLWFTTMMQTFRAAVWNNAQRVALTDAADNIEAHAENWSEPFRAGVLRAADYIHQRMREDGLTEPSPGRPTA